MANSILFFKIGFAINIFTFPSHSFVRSLPSFSLDISNAQVVKWNVTYHFRHFDYLWTMRHDTRANAFFFFHIDYVHFAPPLHSKWRKVCYCWQCCWQTWWHECLRCLSRWSSASFSLLIYGLRVFRVCLFIFNFHQLNKRCDSNSTLKEHQNVECEMLMNTSRFSEWKQTFQKRTFTYTLIHTPNGMLCQNEWLKFKKNSSHNDKIKIYICIHSYNCLTFCSQ